MLLVKAQTGRRKNSWIRLQRRLKEDRLNRQTKNLGAVVMELEGQRC